MDKAKLLDRFSGPAYFEFMRKNSLTRLIMKGDVLVAECKEKAEGYGTSRMNWSCCANGQWSGGTGVLV